MAGLFSGTPQFPSPHASPPCLCPPSSGCPAPSRPVPGVPSPESLLDLHCRPWAQPMEPCGTGLSLDQPAGPSTSQCPVWGHHQGLSRSRVEASNYRLVQNTDLQQVVLYSQRPSGRSSQHPCQALHTPSSPILYTSAQFHALGKPFRTPHAGGLHTAPAQAAPQGCQRAGGQVLLGLRVGPPGSSRTNPPPKLSRPPSPQGLPCRVLCGAVLGFWGPSPQPQPALHPSSPAVWPHKYEPLT